MSLSADCTSNRSIGMGINLTAASVVIMYVLGSLFFFGFLLNTSSKGLIKILILTMTAKLRIELTG